MVDSPEIRELYPSNINYRLKLYEGYQQEYHKDSTILAEFSACKSELANQFWIENEIKPERIETFKDRFKNGLKAAFHKLIVFYYYTVSAPSDRIVYGEMSACTSAIVISERFHEVTVSTDSVSHSKNPVYPSLESMQKGEFSEPILVKDRVFIYILNKINDARILSFEEVYDRCLQIINPFVRKIRSIN